MLKWITNTIELFDIVDKDDNIIKIWIKEENLHINNDITRVVTTYIFNNNWWVYIARRSPNKVVDPLKYEAASHWKVNSWETYDIASKRETMEEVWVNLIKLIEVAHYYVSFNTNVWIRQHYKKLFIWYIDEEINIDKTEIYSIKYFKNINEYFKFYNENHTLFSEAIQYDLDYLKKYFK